MASLNNAFKVGDIVTFKTHPLLSDSYIKGDGKYVPPIMIIKEVFFENIKKKTSDDVNNKEVGELIKYICVYFDDNKSEFVEVHLYEKMLESFKELKISNKSSKSERDENKVITEILSYPEKPDYKYGEILYFKTKKLEILKKRSSIKITKDKAKVLPDEVKEIIQYVVNYATPDFLACGFKIEEHKDLFHKDGKNKRLVSKESVKVKWFNPINNKFSEYYLPIEFFTDIKPFD
ncbi:hypothetical protein [Flavobacterium chungbukense]|uniref:Immunity protein 26 of polymorphic toxin system n=1 Tax=Flavobacterium chungbukense TaxID=877464 RepID=A0ABP7XSA6_9FLAO|nr:hypothetical protein [Flavobacterium chungbukense]MCC4921362.1 hypothetical protein [Flavobacterium chungbukense]